MDLFVNQQWIIIAVVFFGIIFYISWLRWRERKWIEKRFGEERAVARHNGWAMRVEPPPGPGQRVDWAFTAPRLRTGLAVGSMTGLVLLLLLFVGRVREGRRA